MSRIITLLHKYTVQDSCLAYCREKDIANYAKIKAFPIIPCNLCGSQPNLQRQVIGNMLREWDKQYPGRIETMFQAMQNIVPSHLCDSNLFNFKQINHTSNIINGGDLAFDKETFPIINTHQDNSPSDQVNIVEIK